MQSKNILILSSQIPYSQGGAEILVNKLYREVKSRGHSVDVIALPFLCNSHDDLMQNIIHWRSLNLENVNGRKVDEVICTKFPTYYAIHSNKTIWLIHQYRQAYELLSTRFGDFMPVVKDESIRRAILSYDNIAFREARKVYTISDNVTKRLKLYNDIDSKVLEPPISNEIDTNVKISKGSYILCVGRLSSIKRLDLIIKSLPKISRELSLVVVGREDEPGVIDYLNNEIEKNGIAHRVVIRNYVESVMLSNLYANSFCVYFGSYDEDFGFVIYESSAFRKPIVTLDDSGYIASAVKKYGCGVVSKPTIDSIAHHVNELLENQEMYDLCSEHSSNVKVSNTWDVIVDSLLF